MVHDNQVDLPLDRFGDARRRDGQAGHDPANGRLPIAKEQADVVPCLGQRRGCKLIEKAATAATFNIVASSA